MIWIAPSEKDQDTDFLEKRLWAAADQLRANSGLTSQQYSQPVLGLIFLRFAEVRFSARRSELAKAASSGRRGSRVDEPSAYHAEGVLYLSPNSRFDHLLTLPEGEPAGKVLRNAMGVLAKVSSYTLTLWTPLNRFHQYPEPGLSNNCVENVKRPLKQCLNRQTSLSLVPRLRRLRRCYDYRMPTSFRPGSGATHQMRSNSDKKPSRPTWLLSH